MSTRRGGARDATPCPLSNSPSPPISPRGTGQGLSVGIRLFSLSILTKSSITSYFLRQHIFLLGFPCPRVANGGKKIPLPPPFPVYLRIPSPRVKWTMNISIGWISEPRKGSTTGWPIYIYMIKGSHQLVWNCSLLLVGNHCLFTFTIFPNSLSLSLPTTFHFPFCPLFIFFPSQVHFHFSLPSFHVLFFW